MSETERTPGPWRAILENRRWIVVPTGYPIDAVPVALVSLPLGGTDEEDRELREPAGPDGSPFREIQKAAEAEEKADAFLIAAAPEMLESGKAMLAAFGNCGSPAQQAAADFLSAAIAKAEGRS